MPATLSPLVSRWPHRFAVLMACVTFPLLWVGGLVTTYKAGMAVPDWPSTYGYNLFLYPWQTWLVGPWDLFIEHGHRLLGATLGILAIVHLLAAWRLANWRMVSSRSQILWAVIALAAICLQGSLGGMRVLFDEITLAKLHGCIGPAVFALIVAVATMSSYAWQNAESKTTPETNAKLRRLAFLTVIFAYLQLVLGAQLRHISPGLSHGAFRVLVWFHLLGALALVVHAILLYRHVRKTENSDRTVLVTARALLLLVGAQIGLGCAAWVAKYNWPSWLPESWQLTQVTTAQGTTQAALVTAHVAVGSLILATAVAAALWAWRGALVSLPSPRMGVSA
jgi:cytochrome c oxidase assembly protein subunit 15